MPEDILGIWAMNSDSFLQFKEDNIVTPFNIVYQDGEAIGRWSWNDVYYYEPGYQLVIYLTSDHNADVYQVVELNGSRLVWCWVDQITVEGGKDAIGQIIGDIINKAQEGYQLDPELYQSFSRMSEEGFLKLLDSLDLILDPWQWEDE